MQNAYHALSKGLIPDPATFLPVWFISVFSDSAAISVMSFFSSQKTEWFHPVLPDIWHFRSGDRIIIRSKHGSFLKNSECCFWHWSHVSYFPFLDTGCLFPCGSAHFRNWFSPAAFCFLQRFWFLPDICSTIFTAWNIIIKNTDGRVYASHPYRSTFSGFSTSYLVYTK